MATFDVAKLLNKITQDIPGINTVLKALAKWDVSALTDVPDGAMQATTDTNNRLTIKKNVSGSYTPVAKLMHDVDKLDGYHASASATANAVAVRNAQGALPGNILGNSATADTATALATGSVVPVNQGGTGATTASQARANLGVADGADFTTHVATKASPSVEGHVKLDAFAANGSNTAAPGGFGLGMPLAAQIPANTDLDTVVLPGFYSCKMTNTATTLTNCPTTVAFSMLVEYGAYGPTQTITSYNSGARFQRTKTSSTTFGPWRSLPNGITDSTATTSSTVAASATAVKAAYDRAQQVATASISGGVKVGGAISSVSSNGTVTLSSATTTSRGIGRVATLADMEPGAVIENGPAFLAAGSEAERLLLRVADKYDVGEFYYFRHPTLKPGFAPLQGGLISGVYQGKNITKYPIWDYLQTAEGQLLCKTEAEWQAMTQAIWHTNADGTTVGWDGIGGAPYYVQDLGNGTLRMPDLRGMYAEAAGFDSLGVGGTHIDMIRNIVGTFSSYDSANTTGALVVGGNSTTLWYGVGTAAPTKIINLSSNRVVPTGSANKPRAWGALACAFLGTPVAS